MEEFLKVIRERRSVRQFTAEPVSNEDLEKILEAGRWAPSGKNTQPWKFVLVKSREKRKELAECAPQGDRIRDIICSAPLAIAVSLDQEAGYDRVKDIQAIGACAQNMLLTTHALGLGGLWTGKLLNQREKAERILGVKRNEELMLLLLIGHPAPAERSSNRRPLSELVREV